MNVTVLLSSGDTDEWDDIENVRMDMDLGGALVVFRKCDHVVTPEESIESLAEARKFRSPGELRQKAYQEGETIQVDTIIGLYAPGMWMKFMVEEEE